MTAPLSLPALERPVFTPGQRLAEVDFTAMVAWQRELRWLHNRALHGWGIVAGFEVAGARRARELRVAPGFALDCEGRELVLPESVTLQVPAVVGPRRYLLTASWLADADLPASDSREGECLPGGAVRRPERPRIRWQDPTVLSPADRRFRPGYDLILAAADVQGCMLARDASADGRRAIQPAARPRIMAGSTAAGATPWRFVAARQLVVDVDTTSAAFALAPAYSAQLHGFRGVDGFPVDGFLNVSNPTSTGFVATVTLPAGLLLGALSLNPDLLFVPARQAQTLDRLIRVSSWRIAWVGVEGGS